MAKKFYFTSKWKNSAALKLMTFTFGLFFLGVSDFTSCCPKERRGVRTVADRSWPALWWATAPSGHPSGRLWRRRCTPRDGKSRNLTNSGTSKSSLWEQRKRFSKPWTPTNHRKFVDLNTNIWNKADQWGEEDPLKWLYFKDMTVIVKVITKILSQVLIKNVFLDNSSHKFKSVTWQIR